MYWKEKKKDPKRSQTLKKHTSVRLLPSKLDLLTSNHTHGLQLPNSVITTCTIEQPIVSNS